MQKFYLRTVLKMVCIWIRIWIWNQYKKFRFHKNEDPETETLMNDHDNYWHEFLYVLWDIGIFSPAIEHNLYKISIFNLYTWPPLYVLHYPPLVKGLRGTIWREGDSVQGKVPLERRRKAASYKNPSNHPTSSAGELYVPPNRNIFL